MKRWTLVAMFLLASLDAGACDPTKPFDSPVPVLGVNSVGGEFGVTLSADELAKRRAAWVAPAFKVQRGTLAKYIRLVKSASSAKSAATNQEPSKTTPSAELAEVFPAVKLDGVML